MNFWHIIFGSPETKKIDADFKAAMEQAKTRIAETQAAADKLRQARHNVRVRTHHIRGDEVVQEPVRSKLNSSTG